MQDNINDNNISIINMFPLWILIPKDVCSMCISFLSEDDKIYSEGNWQKFDTDKVYSIATKNRWFDLLKWTQKIKYKWNKITSAYAVFNGHLKALKWSQKNECSFMSTYTYAVEKSNSKLLKFARDSLVTSGNGCQWDSWLCAYAVKNGHFEILKWVVLSGLWPKRK
jgi:hypothetical protein